MEYWNNGVLENWKKQFHYSPYSHYFPYFPSNTKIIFNLLFHIILNFFPNLKSKFSNLKSLTRFLLSKYRVNAQYPNIYLLSKQALE